MAFIQPVVEAFTKVTGVPVTVSSHAMGQTTTVRMKVGAMQFWELVLADDFIINSTEKQVLDGMIKYYEHNLKRAGMKSPTDTNMLAYLFKNAEPVKEEKKKRIRMGKWGVKR